MDNQSATSPKQALLERLQQANNILVTVSRNPSVDQLAACLGLTLWINKVNKHGTAVFSGEVPSTLEFLKPEATLEKTTDSLRDFIISLDKSKADKLRYKIEDQVVKIFITPYRTSLSADDLEYSQGDFNVDMVVALGVWSQEDLDNAITAHGRILHDATVATITSGDNPSELGAINWNDGQASSLSELIVELGNVFGRDNLDNQIATALLTGIVAETGRFSNGNTTPQTMSVSAELMAAGADQQLVASELEPKQPDPVVEEVPAVSKDGGADQTPAEEEKPAPEPGTLEIVHDPKESSERQDSESSEPAEAPEDPAVEASQEEALTKPSGDEQPRADSDDATEENQDAEQAENRPKKRKRRRGPQLITQPPSMGGTLTANSRPDDIMREPSSDPMSQAAPQPQLHQQNDTADVPDNLPTPAIKAPDIMPPSVTQDTSVTPVELPAPTLTPPAPAFAPPTPPAAPMSDQSASSAGTPAPASTSDWMPPQPWMNPPAPAMPAPADSNQSNQTLSELEAQAAAAATTAPAPEPADLDDARDEVMKAINAMPDQNLPPVQALNATPIDLTQPQAPTPQSDAPAPAFEMPGAPTMQPPAGPGPNPVIQQPQFANTNFDPGAFDIANDVTQKEADQPTIPPLPPVPNTPDPDLTTPVEQPFTMPLPNALTPPAANPMPPTSSPQDPMAPPPVPPPLMPPGFPPAK